MTEADLKAAVASMRASLTHIEKAMDRADVERTETGRTIDDIRERVVRLESASYQSADLPGRVAHNELENAVQEAVRVERQEVLTGVRKAIFGAIGAVAGLVAIAATSIVWMTGI